MSGRLVVEWGREVGPRIPWTRFGIWDICDVLMRIVTSMHEGHSTWRRNETIPGF